MTSAARPARLRVLVLCTGNSCRSQMAEGWIRAELGDRVVVESAGTHPAERVNPLAVRVMREQGIDISIHVPKGVEALAGRPYDLAITVCDAANESCPVFPGRVERLHFPFPDPVAARGTEEQRLAVYREVRDALRRTLIPEIGARLGSGSTP